MRGGRLLRRARRVRLDRPLALGRLPLSGQLLLAAFEAALDDAVELADLVFDRAPLADDPASAEDRVLTAEEAESELPGGAGVLHAGVELRGLLHGLVDALGDLAALGLGFEADVDEVHDDREGDLSDLRFGLDGVADDGVGVVVDRLDASAVLLGRVALAQHGGEVLVTHG